MLKNIFIFFIAILLLLTGCNVNNGFIVTQWDNPKDASIRIYSVDKVIAEGKTPMVVRLESSQYSSYYYIEICTQDGKKLYGTIEVLNKTRLTELSNVKVEITADIIDRVINNQVSQITVTDPTEGKLILCCNLGSRMPSDMENVSEKLKKKALSTINKMQTKSTINKVQEKKATINKVQEKKAVILNDIQLVKDALNTDTLFIGTPVSKYANSEFLELGRRVRRWCNNSPVNYCVYDKSEDPEHEHCIFCGKAEDQ